jgi:hypothetical protein
MYSRESDVAMGLMNEDKILDQLRYNLCPKYGEEDVVNTKDIYDKYHKYDWEGTTNGTHFEMKSRRIKKQTYPTTIFPVHKVMKTDKPQVFVFNFTDTTSYIEYDKDIFDKFKKRTGQTFRDGRYDPPQLQYEIPVNLLIDFVDIPL